MRRLTYAAAIIAVAFFGGACASTAPAPPAPTEPDVVHEDLEDTSDAATLSADDILEWIMNVEWSFAPDGLLEPETITFVDGHATDEYNRVYEIREGIEGDVNGDGIPDLAVPVSELDGNGFLELWYIWLGLEPSKVGDEVAEQVIYPIARSTRCGDVVHSVSAIDEGFRIDHTLWMPHTDADRDCASGGTGTQVRDITIEMIDGVMYPIQTEPVVAWGGVCPRSDWLDGVVSTGVEGRAAPHPTAPLVFESSEEVAGYELPEATLLTKDGVRFFGFQTEATIADTVEDSGRPPVTMHCGFAG